MTPEGQVVRACLDLLKAERILAFRRNSGVMKVGKRFVRFGTPGEADIECFPYGWVLWVECKATTDQTAEQKSFQDMVEHHCHSYLIVRSSDDLLRWLRSHSGKRLRAR